MSPLMQLFEKTACNPTLQNWIALRKAVKEQQAEIERVTRERDEAITKSCKPDYCYDPDDWEVTYEWADREIITENLNLSPGEVVRVATLIKGPDRWAAHIVMTRDEEGDVEESEIVWFDIEQEVVKALKGGEA